MALSDIVPVNRKEEFLQAIADKSGAPVPVTRIEEFLKRISESSSLPEVTSEDNGDFLAVVDGEWSKAPAPSSLPPYTSADKGKVLTVGEGSESVEPKWEVTGGYIAPTMSTTVTSAITSGINAAITDILQNSKTNLVIKTASLSSYADIESDYEILTGAATKYKEGINVIIPVSATQYSTVVNGGVDIDSSIQFIVPVYGVDIPNVGQKHFYLAIIISGSVTEIFVRVAAQIMEVLI